MTAYWKGKKLSEETKKKLSEAHTGVALSEMHRASISNAQKIKLKPVKAPANILIDEKWCPQCEQVKKIFDFYVMNSGGRPQGYCKTCQKSNVHKGVKDNPIRTSYYQAKIRDKKKGFLTCSYSEWVDAHIHYECVYCGETSKVGIDRKDNLLGHVVGNLATCCYSCNLTRGNRFSYNEMVELLGPALRKIREFRKLKQHDDGLRNLGLFT